MTRPVVIEFRADDGSLIRSMRTTGAQADRLSGQLDNTGNRAEKLGQQSERSATGMNRFRAAAAATAVVLAARVYGRVADDMATINARLRLATDGQQEFNQAQADVTRIANENGRQLGAVAELYTRLSQSLEDYDGKAGDVATITQTVTQAMRVSGTTTAESAGAIRQLSQAFASGVLRGDEFNSVNEQAPRIMQALADSLGVTRGELREMAEQGELTSDVLKTALIDGAQEIAAESAQIPRTVGEAFTELGNSLMLLIGAFDTATGTSQNAGEVVTSFAGRVAQAAQWINENGLQIRLGTIALGETVKIIFAEIGGAFDFVQGVYTEFFALLNNGWNTFIATASNAAASYIEINAAIAEWIPGAGNAAAAQRDVAATLRATAAEADSNIIAVQGLGTVWNQTRASTEQAKDEIRATASAQADAAIAAFEGASAQQELTEATEEANRARTESTERSEEVIKSVDDLARSLAEQTERLREEKIERAAGTRGLIDYRIAKLAAAGATEEEIRALEELRDGLVDQQGALDALNRAQQVAIDQAEAQAQAMLRTAAAAVEAATGLRIFNDENERAGSGSGSGAGFGSAFSSIGSGFAQSIFNGQSISDALESAFTGFGGEQLSKSASQFFDDVASDGLIAAFQNSKTQEGMAGGFALAIGQAFQGNYAQAAFTAAGTAIAGPIGGMIGSIVGSLVDGLFGGRDPAFSVGGSRGDNQFGADEVFESALGPLAFGFRKVPGEARRTIMDAFIQVDQALIGAIRDRGLLEITRRAIETWGEKDDLEGADLAGMIESRVDAVLATLPPVIQAAVSEFAGTVEQQVEVIADVLNINRALRGGGAGLGFMPGGTGNTDPDSLVNSQLEQTVEVLGIVRIGAESLSETFARMASIMETLDLAAAVTGARFAETRRDMVIFGADLAALFGDDAGAVAAQFNRVFEAFYTEEERAAAEADASRARATSLLNDLFTQIGSSVSPLYDSFDASMLTAEGFRELFEALTSAGVLTAQQTALLLQAGGQVADYIDAQEQLNETTNAGTEAMNRRAEAERRAQEAADFMTNINAQLLEQIAPSWASFDQLSQSIAETWQQAQALGLSEEQLARVRQLAQAQLDAFIAQTGRNIETLRDQFTGANNPTELFAGGVENTASRVQAAASSINSSLASSLDSIRDWLDREVLSETSNLTPQERLMAARQQFDDAVASGSTEDLTRLADQLLEEGSGFYGRASTQFDSLRDFVRGTLQGVVDSGPGPDSSPTFGQTAQIVSASQATQSATRDTAAFSFEQLQAANALINEVALMAQATGRLPSEIGDEYDLPMRDLIHAVTGELPDATGDALGGYFDDLVGESRNELTALLDLNAAQAVQQATLESIDSRLARIGALPSSNPDTAPIGAQPIRQVDQTIRNENAALRDEIRALRSEMTALRDLTEQGNRDRRQGVVETAAVGERVRASGESTRREIRDSLRQRRGATA